MLDEETNSLLQIEMNTISCSFPGLSRLVSQLHQYVTVTDHLLHYLLCFFYTAEFYSTCLQVIASILWGSDWHRL